MLGIVRLFDYRCFRREQPATLVIDRGFTAFVGANNAGKSSLIRSLYELRDAVAVARGALQNPKQNLQGQRVNVGLMAPMYEQAEMVCDRDEPDLKIEISVPWKDGDAAIIKAVILRFEPDARGVVVRAVGSDGLVMNDPSNGATVETVEPDSWLVQAGRRYDVRPLRNLLELISDIQFIGPFRNALNEGAGSHFDTRIGTTFIAEWNNWKTGPSRTQMKAIEGVTDDVRRLIGAATLQISASHDQKTLQVSVDKRPQKLQELGSGIAQLIVVLGNALIRKPSLIVIDEPELHLHPGLQVDFLTTLTRYAKYGVLFATHSIGLARSAADRTYTVRKVDGGAHVRLLERTPHYAEFLGSLGIAGLQEIGWDSVLLVEGPKDVRTFQQFLRLFDKDRRVVVLPLGGDSLVNGVSTNELAEILRLCPRVFAVVDSERHALNGAPKRSHEKFAENCNSLGIDCCLTERRAIENYLPQAALDSAFGTGHRELAPFEEPGEIFWGKGESWRAAQRMTREDLVRVDIGQLLSRI